MIIYKQHACSLYTAYVVESCCARVVIFKYYNAKRNAFFFAPLRCVSVQLIYALERNIAYFKFIIKDMLHRAMCCLFITVRHRGATRANPVGKGRCFRTSVLAVYIKVRSEARWPLWILQMITLL